MKYKKVDENRGQRHKKFRKEVLGLTQVDLKEELEKHEINKGQSTISNYDRGYPCAGDVLLFYAERNLNLHWYYTGLGSMLYEVDNGKKTITQNNNTYNSIKENIKFKSNSEPLAEFLRTISNLKNEYISILNSTGLSDNKKFELKSLIIEAISEKTTWLMDNLMHND